MAKQQTSEEQLEALRRKIAELESALEVANEEGDAARQRAAYFAAGDEETPTGRTVKIKKAKNPWVKNADELVFEEVELPTFFYKIDMPPVGGVDIKINGESLYHGHTYEFTLETLRSVKEFVYRLRAHEAAIHGSDEDVYRPRISKQISLKTGGIRNLPANWVPGMPIR